MFPCSRSASPCAGKTQALLASLLARSKNSSVQSPHRSVSKPPEGRRMTPISSIIAALDELLDPAAFEDLGPNGLQVPGAHEVRRVVTGVSAQRSLIERAVDLDAQLVLVHHGLFWDFQPTGLTPLLA